MSSSLVCQHSFDIHILLSISDIPITEVLLDVQEIQREHSGKNPGVTRVHARLSRPGTIASPTFERRLPC
jgi:hypothetical protein